MGSDNSKGWLLFMKISVGLAFGGAFYFFGCLTGINNIFFWIGVNLILSYIVAGIILSEKPYLLDEKGRIRRIWWEEATNFPIESITSFLLAFFFVRSLFFYNGIIY